MYAAVKACVRNMSTLSELFSSDVGLMQGEVISHFLFSLFIDDLETHLQQNLDASISIDQLAIYLLLFANDAVMFSDIPEGLQTSLNNLETYCSKWNIHVNVDQTKIVVFRKGVQLCQNEKFTYAGEEIEIVNNFNYLGIFLSIVGYHSLMQKYSTGEIIESVE